MGAVNRAHHPAAAAGGPSRRQPSRRHKHELEAKLVNG